ncbi:MAG: TIGR04283 family arsenosugar biosynthesis glycosyltransferase [Phycisphaerae bacterium]
MRDGVAARAERTESLPDIGRLSIIIPVLNEAKLLGTRLPSLLADVPDDTQIIVVDGGSADDSRRAAEQFVTVVTSPAGRARQLNCGAAAAHGDVLLFLHADVQLPIGWHDEISGVLANPHVVGGGFMIRAEPRSPSLDFITALSNFRSRFRRRFYGDQAIFVRRSTFRRLGGFDETLSLFEGYDLTRRLRRFGEVACARRYVRASSRRFLEQGIWRTFFAFHYLKLRYFLGTLPRSVETLYPAPSVHNP